MSALYDDLFDDWDAERDEDRWECAFPGNCCMAYTDHMRDECYTAEMAAEYMREAQEEAI